MDPWIETYDESTNMYYYYNTVTQETSWEKPQQQTHQPVDELIYPVDSNIQIQNWVPAYDETSGLTYYVNSVTGETSWTDPAATTDIDLSNPIYGEELNYVASVDINGNGANDIIEEEHWTQLYDESSQRYYYYNNQTNETSWDPPTTIKNLPSNVDSQLLELKSNWIQQVDPATGLTYYQNTITNETQWDPPVMDEVDGQTGPSNAIEGNDELKSETKISLSLYDSYNLNLPSYTNNDNPMQSNHLNEHSLNYVGAPPEYSSNVMSLFNEDMKITRNNLMDDQQKIELINNLLDECNELNYQNPAKISEILISSIEIKLLSNTSFLFDLKNRHLSYYTMIRYAEDHFLSDRRDMNQDQDMIIDKLLSFQPEPLSTPLHSFPSTTISLVLSCIKCIYYFIDLQQSNSASQLEYVLRLIEKIIDRNNNVDLSDEIYCQLFKMVHKNPFEESTERGWQMIIICLACFSPNKSFLPYFLQFLLTNLEISDNNNVKKFITQAITMCFKSYHTNNRKRKNIPTLTEIRSILHGEKVEVNIIKIDQTSSFFMIDSFTSIKELKEMIFDYSQDSSTTQLLFHQAVDNVLNAYYPHTIQDAVILAAIHLQSSLGDYLPSRDKPQISSDRKVNFMENNDNNSNKYNNKNKNDNNNNNDHSFINTNKYDKYISKVFLNNENWNNIEVDKKIIILHKKLIGINHFDAMKMYLVYVSSWKLYGATFFTVKRAIHGNNNNLSELILAISIHSLVLIDSKTKYFIADYPYSDIRTWGHSFDSFVVFTGPNASPTKSYFMTTRGKDIVE
eukprot:gene7950-10786_t